MTKDTFADHVKSDDNQQGFSIGDNGEIVVGDRKFDSPEDLVKSWMNGQQHIQTLEQERAEDREKLAQAKTVEDVIAQLDRQPEPPTPVQTNSQQSETTVTGLTEEDVDKLLTQRERQKIADANKTKSLALAKEVYGSDYINKLDSKTRELGMSTEEAINIASKSPTAFEKLFFPERPQSALNSTGDINPAAVAPRTKDAPSRRVPVGGTSTDLVNAWKASAPNIEE